MATHNQIKFYKGQSAPAALAAGMIWFSTADRTIRVYTGTEWEKYAGLVDATWNGNDKTLVITNAAGTTTTLDLSDCASASDITAKLTTINNTLTAHDGRITTAQTAAETAQAAAEAADAKAVKEAEDRAKEITRVEGLISAEATIARAAEDANAKAAEAADDKAAAAQTYAEGVNTALGEEVTRATNEEVRIAGLVSAEETRAKGVEDELRGLINSAASGATTEVAKAAEAAHITVTESAGDKGQKIYIIGESDIASAQALADEIADRAADEEAINNRINALDAVESGRVSVLEKQVAALNAATHFEGKVEFDPSAEGATTDGYDAGDIVIYGNKEYIFDGTAWIELGDTTAESGRISALEGLVGNTSVQSQISTAIGNALSGLSDESNDSGDANLVKVTVNQADGNVTGVVVDDAKLDAAFKSTNDAVAVNTAAVADYKTRIEALEATSGALGTTYVKAVDYAVDKAAFEEAHAGLQGEINAAKGRLGVVEGEIDNLQSGTGLGSAAAPSYTDANYIASAATLVAADKALDAAIKGVADDLAAVNTGVMSVSAGDYITVGTDRVNPVVDVIVAGSIAEGNTGIVTGGTVFDALCWVEFN